MYQRRTHMPLTPRMGARAGIVGGVLGFVVMVALFAVEIAASGGEVVAVLRQKLSDQIAANPDPRVQQVMQQLLTPGGLAVVVGISMVMMFAFVILCSAAGGALGGYLFGKRKQD